MNFTLARIRRPRVVRLRHPRLYTSAYDTALHADGGVHPMLSDCPCGASDSFWLHGED